MTKNDPTAQARRHPAATGLAGIETERLILRQWRDSDIAANTAMLGDPLSGRFITADRKPDHRSDGRLAQFRYHGGTLGAARLWHVRGRGEIVRKIRRTCRSLLPPVWPGFEVGWGIANGVSRQGLRPRGGGGVDRLDLCDVRARAGSFTASIAKMPRRRRWRGGSAPRSKARPCCSVIAVDLWVTHRSAGAG